MKQTKTKEGEVIITSFTVLAFYSISLGLISGAVGPMSNHKSNIFRDDYILNLPPPPPSTTLTISDNIDNLPTVLNNGGGGHDPLGLIRKLAKLDKGEYNRPQIGHERTVFTIYGQTLACNVNIVCISTAFSYDIHILSLLVKLYAELEHYM